MAAQAPAPVPGAAVAVPLDAVAAPRHALNLTAAVCAGVAVVALVVAAALGQPLSGVALALGLILGGGTGYEVRTEGEFGRALRAACADAKGMSLIQVHLALDDCSDALAVRLLGIGVAFAATSILRLLILTMLAILSGFVLGWERAILVAAGMAVAQLVLSAASLREVLRTR